MQEIEFGREYCAKVSEKINEIIKTKQLKQRDVVQLCKEAGAPISQATISNIKSGSTKITLSSVVSICKGLGVSLFDVLPETGGYKANVLKKNDIAEKEDKKSKEEHEKAYNGYLGVYHVYFFPTISNKEELLHGILHIAPYSGVGGCKTTLKLFTGDKKKVDGKDQEVVKEYSGEFVISIPMQSCYCFLKNAQMDEQCFFVFHHWHIFNNDLLCRVAAAATTSAGGNRRPTIHRIYMCRDKLSIDEQKYIRGQLRLNDSEILVSKKRYKQMISEQNIPEEFCRIFEQEAKIEEYYSVAEAKLINCEIVDKEFAKVISLLRDYSVAPKYNKVSMKTDEFVYENYKKQND